MRSLNFIADCAEADVEKLLQALVSKTTIKNKKPKFMFSELQQQLIVSSTRHQFRETEFSDIALAGVLIDFKPIAGVMEKILTAFSTFKPVVAKVKPCEQSRVSETASSTDQEHYTKGSDREPNCQAGVSPELLYCRIQQLESCMSLQINENQAIIMQLLRVHSAFAGGQTPTLTNSEDCRLMANDLVDGLRECEQRNDALMSQLAQLKSTNRRLERAVLDMTQMNAQLASDAKRARSIQHARKRVGGWGATPSTWKDQ
jgi:hypothetical protein